MQGATFGLQYRLLSVEVGSLSLKAQFMKLINSILMLLLSLFIAHQSRAIVFTSTAGGDWNLGTTWDQTGCAASCTEGVDFPGAGDDIVIKNDVSVIVNIASAKCKDVILGSSSATNSGDGTLQFNAGAILASTGDLSGYRPLQLTSTTDITTGGSISVAHTDASSASDVNIDDGGTTIERTHDMFSALSLDDGIAGGTFDIEATNSGLSSTGVIADFRVTRDGAVAGTHAVATGTVDNPTVKRTGVALGNLSGSRKIGTTDKNSSLFPVVLISFTAELVDNTHVALVWLTASEVNNDYFTIERSTNGLSFKEIAQIRGAGKSNRELKYESFDESPIEGISYYRLKQYDFDGAEEIFNMVAVRFEKNLDGSCILRVFPNPCIGQCTINLSECEHNVNAEIKVEMIDALGNLVYSRIPYREFDGSFQFSVDSSNNLKPGVYIVRGTSKSESYTNKVIVK